MHRRNNWGYTDNTEENEVKYSIDKNGSGGEHPSESLSFHCPFDFAIAVTVIEKTCPA